MSNAASFSALSPAPQLFPVPTAFQPLLSVSKDEASFIASHLIGREAVCLIPCLAQVLAAFGPSWSVVAAEMLCSD